MPSTGKARALLGAFVVLGLGLPAHAHHSGAAYDGTQTLRIEGTVESWRFANPHCSLQIRAADGATLWSFEGNPAGMMQALGYRRNTFAPAARVVVLYNPMKDGQAGGGRLVGAILDGGATVGQVPSQ
jgi:hypothetical protein